MSSRLADKLAQLEQGLQSVLVQEAETEARLEQLRDARKRQEGAVLAVRQLVSEEAAPVQDTQEVNDGALH
jgi:hypothetical protein